MAGHQYITRESITECRWNIKNSSFKARSEWLQLQGEGCNYLIRAHATWSQIYEDVEHVVLLSKNTLQLSGPD